MEFLINYVSIWEKEWFRGLCCLLFDVITIGAALFFLIIVVGSILLWIFE